MIKAYNGDGLADTAFRLGGQFWRAVGSINRDALAQHESGIAAPACAQFKNLGASGQCSNEIKQVLVGLVRAMLGIGRRGLGIKLQRLGVRHDLAPKQKARAYCPGLRIHTG